MIDEEWLAGLQFEGPGGLRVHGLAGLGSQKVVLQATMPDGKEVVLQAYRHHLGFHIREIPLFLTGDKPLYRPARVNQKLVQLVGNPMLDGMTCEYDRLSCSLMRILHETGLSALLMHSAMADLDSTESMSFFLHTPGFQARLADWAALPREAARAEESILTVNGPNFSFTQVRPLLIDWARTTLAEIAKVRPGLRPADLPHNPLYVWGAAVMDGFFTDQELPEAAAFLQEQFGPLRKHPKAVIFLEQAKALAHLLTWYLKESKVARFVQFCGLLGFSFQVRDQTGRIVAAD